ncbi:MAG: hypothetical protein V9E98_07785 [Candidatus Nanopelagicales bacterium]
MSRLLKTVALLVLGVLTLGLVWLMGMRNKRSIVVRTQRRINRAVFNPRQMKTAGRPGAYAGIVHHIGRTSERDYRTPVGVMPTDDGFVVALVYGSETDWLKNVLARGSATITHDGRTYDVDQPAVVPLASVADAFPESELRSMRVVGVRECLRVRRVPLGAAGSSAAEPI